MEVRNAKTILYCSVCCCRTDLSWQQHQRRAQVRDRGRSGNCHSFGRCRGSGSGDTDGSGTATLIYNHDKGELCFELSVKDIQEASSAHIHAGAAGADGDVKVTLKAPAGGMSKGCVSVDKALLKEIAENPGNFYVNVHNAEFPKGAIRGQLGK